MAYFRRKILTVIALGAALMLTACAANSDGNTQKTSVDIASANMPTELRFGYFPNFTHAVAIVALERGYLASHLGKSVKLAPVTFNAGPAAVEALFGGAVDVTLAGPNPTITGFVQSKGAALEVISGAASGGAGLVVRKGITSAADLKGKKIASPQLGNTQDVALRYWLKKKGLTTTTEGGGDVHIVPQDNATALAAFIAGNIDGAWVPEPWVTRLVAEGNGTELVDESSLWKNGKFVVANTVAATAFAKKYPAAITAVIAAELDAIAYIKSNPEAAKKLVNASIKTLTGSAIDPTYLDKAWANVDFTIDPLPSTLLASANHAHSLGLLDSVDLAGLYDLAPLNSLLAERGEKKVDAP